MEHLCSRCSSLRPNQQPPTFVLGPFGWMYLLGQSFYPSWTLSSIWDIKANPSSRTASAVSDEAHMT